MNVTYESSISADAQTRMNVLFDRWGNHNQEHEYHEQYYVRPNVYRFEEVYNVYENGINGIQPFAVYIRARIRRSGDYALFMANGTKSMGPCDGFDYRFKNGPICADWFTKHWPIESNRQLLVNFSSK